MIRKCLLLTIMIGFTICSYGQNRIDMVEILNIRNEIQSLENQISKRMKKYSFLAKKKGLQQFHVFWLNDNELEPLKRKDFSDSSFLYQFQAYYRPYYLNFFRRKKKYLQSYTLICDSIGQLLAIGYPNSICTPYQDGTFSKDEIELANMFHRKEIDFAFYPTGRSLSSLIALKDNDIYILHSSEDGLIKYPLKEFIDCCYDKWKPSWEEE